MKTIMRYLKMLGKIYVYLLIDGGSYGLNEL